jgi:hypothetical protein
LPGVLDAMSPREVQTAQLVVGIATAVFIGGRFLPVRYRWSVGVGLTVCYLIGLGGFAIYVLVR